MAYTSRFTSGFQNRREILRRGGISAPQPSAQGINRGAGRVTLRGSSPIPSAALRPSGPSPYHQIGTAHDVATGEDFSGCWSGKHYRCVPARNSSLHESSSTLCFASHSAVWTKTKRHHHTASARNPCSRNRRRSPPADGLWHPVVHFSAHHFYAARACRWH